METKSTIQVSNHASLIVYLSPRGSLTGTLSSVGVPPDFLSATDEDIDNLFNMEETKNG